MLFMGAMMLVVMPIFLVISARMVAKSSFGKRPSGLILQGVFYIFALMAIVGLISLTAQIIRKI